MPTTRAQEANNSPLPDRIKKLRIPKSCIESSCHIIQCFAEQKAVEWQSHDTTTDNGVGVWAVFGNKMLCVNRLENLQDYLTGVTDFSCNGGSFGEHLQTGRGIMLANCTTDTKFNMHLGAVLYNEDGEIVLSDLSEEPNTNTIPNVPINNLNCIPTDSSSVLDDFRAATMAILRHLSLQSIRFCPLCRIYRLVNYRNIILELIDECMVITRNMIRERMRCDQELAEGGSGPRQCGVSGFPPTRCWRCACVGPRQAGSCAAIRCRGAAISLPWRIGLPFRGADGCPASSG